MGDAVVGVHARMMSKAMRKLTAVIGRTETIAVFINQIREKVGIMFGNPETTTGGKALKFFSTIRLEVRKGEAIKQGTEVVGNRVKIKVAKNKVAPPFKTAEFDLMYGTGYSRTGSILDMGVEFEIITKSGAFYSYEGTRLGQGRENAKKFLADNPEMATTIENKIREAILSKDIHFENSAEVETETVAEENFDD